MKKGLRGKSINWLIRKLENNKIYSIYIEKLLIEKTSKIENSTQPRRKSSLLPVLMNPVHQAWNGKAQ